MRLLAFRNPLDVSGPNRLRQMLQIDLMADAGARRHHAEIVERLLAPAQKGIALAIALILEADILGEGFLVAEMIDHDRVVDHQIDRRQRIDLLGVAAHGLHGVAHGRQIDHGGHAGEILHQHARRAIGDFAVGFAVLQPGADGLDIVHLHRAAVLMAQQVFQQHLHGNRQPADIAQTRLLGGGDAEIVIALAADLQRAACLQAVQTAGHYIPSVKFLPKPQKCRQLAFAADHARATDAVTADCLWINPRDE